MQLPNFHQLLVDSLPQQVAVIDAQANMVYTNQAWIDFKKSYPNKELYKYLDKNYLAAVDFAIEQGNEESIILADGIRNVLTGKKTSFYFEYDYNAPEKYMWFMVQILPMVELSTEYFAIIHQEITQRKQAERQAYDLSNKDWLTGLKNRRSFEDLYSKEWRRCERANTPLSLIMLDIDFFKNLNDQYGHQQGDDCLQQLGETLSHYAQRPTDIVARYGGEEFVLAFGNTTLEEAKHILNKIFDDIAKLAIPNKASSISDIVTVSAGLVSIIPRNNIKKDSLIKQADELLYTAKRAGRNTMRVEHIEHEMKLIQQ